MLKKNSLGSRRAFLVLFLFLIATLAEARGQAPKSDAAKHFDAAAAKHKRELIDLIEARGSSPVELRDVTTRSIAKVMAARSKGRCTEAGYPEGTAVLFYSYENGHLHSWVLNEGGVRGYEATDVSQGRLLSVIGELRKSFGTESIKLSTGVMKRGEPFGTVATKLSPDLAIKELTRILIPPRLGGSLSEVKHLIIVPVLGLGTVPYAVLRPFDTHEFLIDRMSISVAPSLFDIGQNIRCWDPDLERPLVVGNPYLPSSGSRYVTPLPGAQLEAVQVAKAVGAEPLLGKSATKVAVVSKAPGSDFLWFATHGVADPDDPLSGGYLMLSADTLENGLWTAKEIQKTDLSGCRIAVLSACQTGLGRIHEAGIIGLGRAFQIAGVPRVVMSLWNVNDEATNELMQRFVVEMKTNVPSEALRQAMLQTKRSRPAPDQWAAFVLFGTPR